MRLISDRRAVTALEYGIILGVMALVLVGIFTRFGTALSTVFSGVAGSM